jgi:hypothetical protein
MLDYLPIALAIVVWPISIVLHRRQANGVRAAVLFGIAAYMMCMILFGNPSFRLPYMFFGLLSVGNLLRDAWIGKRQKKS